MAYKGGSNVDLGREKQDRQLAGTHVEIPSSLEIRRLQAILIRPTARPPGARQDLFPSTPILS